MVTEAQIHEAVAILAREANPEKIVLFGSYARGEAGPDSDVDFLVISKNVENRRKESVRLRRAVSPLRISADVIVVSEAHANSHWADFPGSYLYYALREGKTLYAAAN